MLGEYLKTCHIHFHNLIN